MFMCDDIRHRIQWLLSMGYSVSQAFDIVELDGIFVD